jgi:hypothetical protein
VSDIVTTDSTISFNVDPETVATRSPVLVKTSYFPNWQAIGADGPWRVTPNLMVVIPTSTHVELHYGYTPVDNAGRLASVAGLAAAGAMWWWDRRLDPDSDTSSVTSPAAGPGPTDDDPWATVAPSAAGLAAPVAPPGPPAPAPAAPAAPRAGPWADETDQSSDR